ncbi:unnamed protein product [Adineta ricciae]|uniref:Uncharacterized protein n=1 Tax=Adineta ricciae TaxID=249248 RepID=A0A815JVG5_ADIRI|nr:unnamed protein product [Adineta ricciae]CAF1381644.1 unnamed protein product [Adineta ricciae]
MPRHDLQMVLLLAELCVAQDQHRQAIKIQELNLANDDLAIKLVYYQLKQFDQALAKYAMADTDTDEDTDEDLNEKHNSIYEH